MKKIASVLIGLGMMTGTVVVATPANAVSCEALAPYNVKELKKKYKKKKRQCIRLERQQQEALNAQKVAVPPTVANLVVVAPTTEEQDYNYRSATSKYAVSWQMPEGAPVNHYIVTEGNKTETVYASSGNCVDGVCTYTKDYMQAPWSTSVAVGVTSVSSFGVTSEMVVSSGQMPARPKQTVTYTFRASGNYSSTVPNNSGGETEGVGYMEFSKEFSRGASPKWYNGWGSDAFSFDGEAWCEVLRDGVRIDFEQSNGRAVGAYCWL